MLEGPLRVEVKGLGTMETHVWTPTWLHQQSSRTGTCRSIWQPLPQRNRDQHSFAGPSSRPHTARSYNSTCAPELCNLST
mmetsp:Transcript_22336/g.48811  ORF Transcript_22336/g.48811 Transcript_22336/m.48811 type:complete len:80 (-) Transcript_22336:552-791(-)